jgi:RimJ/RimL family protein N-acetyltransferase
MQTQWGCGYATESAAAIRDWAYRSLPIDLLVSLISPANVRSQRVARRVGATPSETITPVHTMQETVVWRHPPPT